MLVKRTARQGPLAAMSWDDRWNGPDQGLIQCWERGREKAERDPELATRAKAGELPPLAWKGGVERALKAATKVGSLCYLATWQGLRGDDLAIDPAVEVEHICSRTNMRVLFTSDIGKLLTEAEGERS